jgi:EmrB/QacA subfamily drug resistance transporter
MSSLLHAPCDAARAQATPCAGQPAHATLILATTILASSLAFIDGSVVNVGLPAIGASLGADAGALQWIVNAYLLPLSALLLLGGAASDRFGRRRLLMAGIVVFAVGSLGCALAPSLAVLLGARMLQGAGAALLLPSSLAILGSTFSGPAKGRATGWWAASSAAMGAAGPVLGGWLIDLGNWRAIFLLNLPLAAIAFGLAWRYVPRDAETGAPPLDALGGALATVGLGALTWALTVGAGPSGWTATSVITLLLAAALLLAFVKVQQQRGERAMMPLSLFGSRTFVGLTLATLFLYAALGALVVLLPYLLIQAGGYSGTAAGAALLPLPLLLTIASPAMGALATRVGARWLLVLGCTCVAIGLLLAVRVDARADYWTQVLPAITFVAIGLGAAVAPLTSAVLASVDARHTASASGFNSAVARTGGLIATALLGSVLAAEGAALLGAFRVAMIAGALACLLAAASAFMLPLRPQR